jgi:very-short-patch-repair endonuclease
MASGVVGIQRVSEEKLQDARALRKNMTPTEALLWERLRNRKCGGFKFRRQQIIEGFVADFYCEQAQLVVEVDGGIHSDFEVKKNDQHRETVFKARGIKTIRFMNDDVKQNIDSVITRIIAIGEKNRKKSKLSEWEKRRCITSDSSFSSGVDAGIKKNTVTGFSPLTSGEGTGVRS